MKPQEIAIKACQCGAQPEYFGEALMGSITCPGCGESLMGVGWNLDIRNRWNRGERGMIEEEHEDR